MAVGPRLLEAAAERWAGEHGAFAFCLSDRIVWGRERGPLFHVLSRINKFLQLCHQGWGSEVGRPRPPESSLGLLEQEVSSLWCLGARAERCLRGSPGQVREVLSEPLSSSLNWEVLCSSLLGWWGRGRMCQSLSSAVAGPCPWGSPGGPATAGEEMMGVVPCQISLGRPEHLPVEERERVGSPQSPPTQAGVIQCIHKALELTWVCFRHALSYSSRGSTYSCLMSRSVLRLSLGS